MINTVWVDPHSDLLQNALMKPKNKQVSLRYLTIVSMVHMITKQLYYLQLNFDNLLYNFGLASKTWGQHCMMASKRGEGISQHSQ